MLKATYSFGSDSAGDDEADPDADPSDEMSEGGCAATGNGSGIAGGLLVALGLLLARRRRR